MHSGRGPGLTDRRLGQRSGVGTVTLTTEQIPNHTHAPTATTSPATSHTPSSSGSLARSVGGFAYNNSTPGEPLNDNAVSSNGGSQPHNNMQPYLAINYIIALVGLYPSRS